MFIPPGQMFVKYFVKQSMRPTSTETRRELPLFSLGRLFLRLRRAALRKGSAFPKPSPTVILSAAKNLALPPWNLAPETCSLLPASSRRRGTGEGLFHRRVPWPIVNPVPSGHRRNPEMGSAPALYFAPSGLAGTGLASSPRALPWAGLRRPFGARKPKLRSPATHVAVAYLRSSSKRTQTPR